MGKKKHKITLTDKNNPNEKVKISLVNGLFSIQRISIVKTKTNINNEIA